MTPPDPRQLVREGYDHLAPAYLAHRDKADAWEQAALERLGVGLPPETSVLDLGCGAGVPVTQWLAARYTATGVDLSARQLELARQLVPGATFQQADMSTLDFPPGTFHAVVAFYSIIHVPREEQPALLARLARWLRPGGAFLATWAVGAWEGSEVDWEGWGAPMWWSHYDGPTNLAHLQAAGFTPTWAEPHTAGGETWLWVLAHTQA